MELRLGDEVVSLNSKSKTATLRSGDVLYYDAALIATGADAQRLAFIPGADLPQVHVLRTVDDAQQIFAESDGKRVVVVGSSFIGMEVAACLNRRAASVTVIGMEKVPFERVLGPEVGAIMHNLHKAKGVSFRLSEVTDAFVQAGDAVTVRLKSGEELIADLVVIGAGVVPATAFLVDAGVELGRDKSVVVDEYLSTGAAALYAAGDVARYPYHLLKGELVRIEHYGQAMNEGKVAALNMLAGKRKYKMSNIPVFWTQQYGKSLRYAGHALAYDEIIMDTDGKEMDSENPAFVAYYIHNGIVAAVATMNRDPAVAQVAELLAADVTITAREVRDSLKLTRSTRDLLSHRLADVYNARH